MKPVYSLDAAEIAEIDPGHVQNLDWTNVGYLVSIQGRDGPDQANVVCRYRANIGAEMADIGLRSGPMSFGYLGLCLYN